MKNIGSIITCLILGIILFFLCFDYNKMKYPNELYNVYLDGNYLGTIDSKDNLEKYIDEKASHLINVQEITTTYCENDKTLEQIIIDENLEDAKEIKYYDKDDKKCMDVTIVDGEQIEKIYTPNGLNIEKVLTYNGEINSVEDIYSKIVDMKSFTVQGYQFTAREEDKEKYFYVIDKDIFEEAVKQLINTYVGEDEYNAYLDGNRLYAYSRQSSPVGFGLTSTIQCMVLTKFIEPKIHTLNIYSYANVAITVQGVNIKAIKID